MRSGRSASILAILLLLAQPAAAITVRVGGEVAYATTTPTTVPVSGVSANVSPRAFLGEGVTWDPASASGGRSWTVDTRALVASLNAPGSLWVAHRAVQETRAAYEGGSAQAKQAWRGASDLSALDAAFDRAQSLLWGEDGLVTWASGLGVDPSQMPPFENGGIPNDSIPGIPEQLRKYVPNSNPKYYGLDGKQYGEDDLRRGRGFAMDMPSQLDPVFEAPDLPWDALAGTWQGAESSFGSAESAPGTLLAFEEVTIDPDAARLEPVQVDLPENVEPLALAFDDVDVRLDLSLPPLARPTPGTGEGAGALAPAGALASNMADALSLATLPAMGSGPASADATNPAAAAVPEEDRLRIGAAALLASPDAGPMAWILLVLGGAALPFWALYRRVVQSRALDNPHRRRLNDAIRREPGITPAELQRHTGLHYTTCVHHLRILQELGLVELRRVGGQIHCFEQGRRLGSREMNTQLALRSATTRELLEALARSPGLTPSQAAAAMGMHRSSIKYHVDRLRKWDLVDVRRNGRQLELRLQPGVLPALAATATSAPAVAAETSPLAPALP
jgi:predicted transcriptional regulator